MRSTAKTRLIVAGAGLIGQAHIKRILDEPGAELAGIVDPVPDIEQQAEEAGWWSPLRCERCVVPAPDPRTLQSVDDPLTNEMRHFCDVACGTDKSLLDARGGTKTLEATLAVRETARTGQPLFLS